MNKIYRFFVVACLCAFAANMQGQCTSPNAYGTIVVNGPLPNYTNFYSCTYAEEYNTITANYAGVYTFSVENGGVSPIYLTLKDGANNNIVFGSSPLTATLSSTGTYYLHVTETGPPNCTTNQTCHSTWLQVMGLPGSPTITSQPDSLLACANSTVQFSCSAAPANVTYQWQEDSGNGFVNLTNGAIYSGVTTPVLTLMGVTTNMTYYSYRCVVTNSVSPNPTDAAMLTVIGTATMPFTENFENVALDLPTGWANTVNPWFTLSGHGTNNSYGMARNLYGSSNTLAEAITPQIGPITASTSIAFDYRVVDYSSYPSIATPTANIANDSLNVYASNNCGATFTLIGTVNASNHVPSLNFVNVSFPLGAYANSNLSFKFIGKKDPNTSSDYYFDVDNINLFNTTAQDAGVSSILSPSATGCYSTSVPVIVTIMNYGTASVTNVPVTVTVTGANNQTLSATFSGSIGVAGTATFNVGTVNMGMGGVYTFSAATMLPGDGNPNNDMSVTTRTVSPLVSINAPGAICMGNSATLTANGSASTYTWSNSAGSSSIVVNPTVTTTYSVTGTNTAGCMASAMVTLSVQNPTIVAMGGIGCGNTPTGVVSVMAFTPAVVNWYASQSSTVSLATGNTYSVSAASTATYFAQASSMSADSLFTTLAAGNGFAGNMFDVTATNAVTINKVDMHFDSQGTTTVEVWYRPGSFVGFETSNAGWTQAYTTTVSTQGSGVLTPIPGTFAINVPAGQTYGLYVTTVNGSPQTNYTNGTNLGNLYASNADLKFFEGKGGGYFSVNNSPRVFNGQLHYSKQGCTSPKIPVVFTVTSTASVAAMASNTMICTGQSATLTATGAVNYTWMPGGATTSSIVVTPTTNTTYSVMASVNTCTASATTNLMVTVCTGFNELAAVAENISIYPNPNNGSFNVIMPNAGGYKIELMDITGRVVYKATLNSSSTAIDMRELANGLYNYKISSTGNAEAIKSGKIVKE